MRVLSLSLLLGALTLAACGGEDGSARTGTTVEERGWFAYEVSVEPPAGLDGGALATWRRGQQAFNQMGCLACHQVGRGGTTGGPGPDLTQVGGRLSAEQIREVLVEPKAPMPSFGQLASRDPRKFAALVDFLDSLE
ncbi:MAG TPA: c-type cytochrome [Conexibacter sp.]|nr:c-type cytochrome [Conexibacter sp.]